MPRQPKMPTCGLPIHITGRCNNKEDFPVSLDEAWGIFGRSLHFMSRAFSVRIISFVLMPNHFHLLAIDPSENLSQAMQRFMFETSTELSRASGRINKIWGSRFHDSTITENAYYFAAYRYVYQNPVRANLCANILDWKYSTLRGLLGFDHLLIPTIEDDTLFSSPEKTLEWLAHRQNEDIVDGLRRGFRRKTFIAPVHRTKKTKMDFLTEIPAF